MGLFDKVLGGKSPEEKEDKRKKKFRKNELEIDGLLKEFTPKITKSPQKPLFRIKLAKNVELAKTKEEYEICANQFKKWLDIPIEFFNMDLSLKQLTWGVQQNQMDAMYWNSFSKTLDKGFESMAVAGQYEELIETNRKYYDELLPILARIRIMINRKSTFSDHIDMSLTILNKRIALYSAFALYKLGKSEEAKEIFSVDPNFKIQFDGDENDYEMELFRDYNNEIDPRDFIRRMNQGTMTCPNCGKEINERAIRCKYCKTMLKQPEE